MKIMKIIELNLRITKNQNYRISKNIQRNYENQIIPRENYENHEILEYQ